MEQAIAHCTRGLGIWEWAGTEELGSDPDVVIAAAGDVPTLEALAAVDILRTRLPGPEDPVRQRGRPDAVAGRQRASARAVDRDFDMVFTATSRSSSPTTATRG